MDNMIWMKRRSNLGATIEVPADQQAMLVASLDSDAHVRTELVASLGGATACIPADADRIAVLRAVHDAARNRLHLGGVARQVLRRATSAP